MKAHSHRPHRYPRPAFRDELSAYAPAGGNLLLVGPGTAQLFERELGIALQGNPSASAAFQLSRDATDVTLTGRVPNVTLAKATRALGELRAAKPPDAPAHRAPPFGLDSLERKSASTAQLAKIPLEGRPLPEHDRCTAWRTHPSLRRLHRS